jgi:very-short-patch-repair endonuclease
VLIDQRFVDEQEDSVSDEARKVVDLVLQHAESRPEESLGVIALGIKHQRRIEAALDAIRRERPDLEEFFTEARHERFFVKNLERVQGDERDAVILSVGYGKDRSGKLPHRFGPLRTEGGRRRMNVAVTRARKRMTVVSSFGPNDLDPEKCKEGVEFLRLYLQYAMSGGTNLGTEQRPEVPLNDFEQGVHDALVMRGIRLLKQWGASRYRIDLVAQHPAKPGRHILAIECDGATYHSAQSSRDRDRLRQQHLESLGWRFHRIWSTDWFNNRADELERALKAYEAALREADLADAGHEAPRRSTHRAEPTPDRPKRQQKPSIPQHDSIEHYTDRDLIRCVEWIMSDELLRTDEEMLEEMISVLGFERRGSRIVERIQTAIRAARARAAFAAEKSSSAE